MRSLSIAIAVLTVATAAAQTPPSPLAFEVASIKRNQSGDDIAEGGAGGLRRSAAGEEQHHSRDKTRRQRGTQNDDHA